LKNTHDDNSVVATWMKAVLWRGNTDMKDGLVLHSEFLGDFQLYTSSRCDISCNST
jgi:hypothetical protein